MESYETDFSISLFYRSYFYLFKEDEDYDDMGDMEEEDDGQGDDDQLEDILDNDLSWELEIARRRKRWRNKEAQLRDACKKTNSNSSTSLRLFIYFYTSHCGVSLWSESN